MTSPTSAFFEGLSDQGRLPMLARASGTIRFEILRDGEPQHWAVAVHRGNVLVSRQVDVGDCVVRATGDVFDEIVSGRGSAVAALLRGTLSLEGDPELLVLTQRLFASAPGRQP